MGVLGPMIPQGEQEPGLTSFAQEQSELARTVGYAQERNYEPVTEGTCNEELQEGDQLTYMDGWSEDEERPTELYMVRFNSLCPPVEEEPRSANVTVTKVKWTETGREVGEELEASRLTLYRDLLAKR